MGASYRYVQHVVSISAEWLGCFNHPKQLDEEKGENSTVMSCDVHFLQAMVMDEIAVACISCTYLKMLSCNVRVFLLPHFLGFCWGEAAENISTHIRFDKKIARLVVRCNIDTW